MVRFFIFLIITIYLLIIFRSQVVRFVSPMKRKGLYPKKGKATMFDVRRLILEGENDLAIEIYCKLFSTNHREAKKAVEELKKSIQEKKPGLE